MDPGSNSRPLLESNSDSEDVNTDDIHNRSIQEVMNQNIVGASSNGSRIIGSISDTEDDDYVDDTDTDNLYRAPNTIPNDSFNFTYIVFYYLGMTTMLPWNFFSMAEDVSAYISTIYPQ